MPEKVILPGRVTAAISILSVLLMILLSLRYPGRTGYIVVMALMLLFMITIGLHISRRASGVLINERNLISLARFQLVMWTLIILSAFLAAVLGRIKAGGAVADALAIGFDQRLLGLIGITTASLVGTPLLQSTKKVQEPRPEAVEKAARDLKATEDDVTDNAQGVLFANPNVADASFSDMFQGDEVTNKAYVDVAKLQMFFFTVIAGLTYGVELYRWLAENRYLGAGAAFPTISAGLMAVLAISHAGFQVNNSVTKTPTV